MPHISLQAVVVTHALRDPGRSIRDVGIGLGRRGIEHGSWSERRRASRRGARHGRGCVLVLGKYLVITVRPDIADGKRGSRGDLLFNLEGPRQHGWGSDIRLHVAGRDLSAAGGSSAGKASEFIHGRIA